jgi:hypothetical protein
MIYEFQKVMPLRNGSDLCAQKRKQFRKNMVRKSKAYYQRRLEKLLWGRVLGIQ